jgi:anti-sigma B factor antagonist
MATDLLTIVCSHHRDGRVDVTLRGELDLHGCPRVTALASDAVARRCNAIEVDATALDFIDSAGLRALLNAQRHANDHGVAFRVVKASDAVDRIFEMTGVGPALKDA